MYSNVFRRKIIFVQFHIIIQLDILAECIIQDEIDFIVREFILLSTLVRLIQRKINLNETLDYLIILRYKIIYTRSKKDWIEVVFKMLLKQ